MEKPSSFTIAGTRASSYTISDETLILVLSPPNWLVPTGDRLILANGDTIEYSVKTIGSLSSGKATQIHHDFADVRSADDASRFANKWGALGLPLHRECPPSTQWGERLTEWLREVERIRTVIGLWRRLRLPKSYSSVGDYLLTVQRDYYEPLNLCEQDRPRAIRHLFSPDIRSKFEGCTWKLDNGQTEQLDLSDCDDNPRQAAVEVIEYEVARALQGVSIGLPVHLTADSARAIWRPVAAQTLLQAIWCSFILEASGTEMILCPRGCGNWFQPEGKQTTCGNDSCRKAHYRRRKKSI